MDVKGCRTSTEGATELFCFTPFDLPELLAAGEVREGRMSDRDSQTKAIKSRRKRGERERMRGEDVTFFLLKS